LQQQQQQQQQHQTNIMHILTKPTIRERRPLWRGSNPNSPKIVRASNVHAHARTKQNSANRRTKQSSVNSLDQFWGALDEEEFAGERLRCSTTRTTDKVSDTVSNRRRRDKQFSSQTQKTDVSVSENFDEELVALVKTPGAPTTKETSRLIESDENSLIASDDDLDKDRTSQVENVNTAPTKETRRLIDRSDGKEAPRKWGFLSRLRKSKR
jgi:hypothetical protein